MKKTFFLAALLFSFHIVNAQEAATSDASPQTTEQSFKEKKRNHNVSPDQKADKFTAKMIEAVGLQEGQKNKVRSLALDHFKYMDVVKKQANGDKEKIKIEEKKSRKMLNEGLKKVLSPTQFEAWKAKRKESPKQQKGTPNSEPNESIED